MMGMHKIKRRRKYEKKNKSHALRRYLILPSLQVIFLSLFNLGGGPAGCGGGGDNSTPQIDTTGTVTAMATLSELTVDQFAFYVNRDEFQTFGTELWIIDAESGESILCSTLPGADDTETVIYGNLGGSFTDVSSTSGYEGTLFQVRFYLSDQEPCIHDGEDDLVAKTAIVNYDSLISRPLTATNGKFYARLRDSSTDNHDLPRIISGIMGDNTLVVDQVQVENTFGDPDTFDDELETEVHVVDADSGEMIACSGDSEGMTVVQSVSTTYGRLLGDLINADGEVVNFSDHEGQNVTVQLVENDGTACPDARDDSDDLIGEWETLVWDDLPGRSVNLTNDEAEEAGLVVFGDLAQ